MMVSAKLQLLVFLIHTFALARGYIEHPGGLDDTEDRPIIRSLVQFDNEIRTHGTENNRGPTDEELVQECANKEYHENPVPQVTDPNAIVCSECLANCQMCLLGARVTTANKRFCDVCLEHLAPTQHPSTGSTGTNQNKKPRAKRRAKSSPSGKVVYKCSSCGKENGYRGWMQKHEAVCSDQPESTGEKIMTAKCPFCSQLFSVAKDMRKHIRVEIQNKRRKCKNGQLGAEGEFKCATSKCDYKSSDLELFMQHTKRAHLNRKQFSCGVCDMRFVRQELFKNHLGERHDILSWVCKHCEAGFKTNGELSKHKTEYHKWICETCKREWAYECKLERHLKSKEGCYPRIDN